MLESCRRPATLPAHARKNETRSASLISLLRHSNKFPSSPQHHSFIINRFLVIICRHPNWTWLLLSLLRCRFSCFRGKLLLIYLNVKLTCSKSLMNNSQMHPSHNVFSLPLILLVVTLLVSCVNAQYPPPITPETNLTIIKSPVDGNITISYKSPLPGTCTTIFENQRQFTGYVNLPPYTLAPIQQNYSINTFFWFVEARTSPETAPLTVWINGGPGSSSMIG